MSGLIDLRGQVAVVTGGGRGLGRAFAQALATAGCSVAVIARSATELAETVTLIKQPGRQARAFPTDVTGAAAIRDTLAEIEQSIGPIDPLVNNAGVHGPLGPFAVRDRGLVAYARRQPARPGGLYSLRPARDDRASERPNREYCKRWRRHDAPAFLRLRAQQDCADPFLRVPRGRGQTAQDCGVRDGARNRAYRNERALFQFAGREDLAAMVSRNLRFGPPPTAGTAGRIVACARFGQCGCLVRMLRAAVRRH
jgi:NAD(P)-dependent dehydrogenase (short-subunit alcohol dehydrogenase family)